MARVKSRLVRFRGVRPGAVRGEGRICSAWQIIRHTFVARGGIGWAHPVFYCPPCGFNKPSSSVLKLQSREHDHGLWSLLPAKPTGAGNLVTLVNGRVKRRREREPHFRTHGAAPGFEPASSDGVAGSTPDALTHALQPCRGPTPDNRLPSVVQNNVCSSGLGTV